jgi:hypothetical protein
MFKIFQFMEDHGQRMFEKMALRKIFREKRDLVEGWWRRMFYCQLRGLYSSQGIIAIIKPKRMKWT